MHECVCRGEEVGGGVVLVAATSASKLLRSSPGAMVEKQLEHTSATPTSSELWHSRQRFA